MSKADTTIFAMNMVMSFLAGTINLLFVKRPGPFVEWVPLRAVVALLAYTYSLSYAVLLAGLVDVTQWGTVMRGVALVVWPVVWAGPAIVSLRSWGKVERLAGRYVKEHEGGD